MRIDNATININLQSPPALATALLAAIMAKLDKGGEDGQADTSTDAGIPPRIGDVWPDQGGIYAGVARGVNGQPDMHLVLASIEPDDKLAWQPALDWAKSLNHEGFTDWSVPTRFESALLYANLQESFDTAPWYWTSTQCSDASFAWTQGFGHGSQLSNVKSYEGRVRAVRRFAA